MERSETSKMIEKLIWCLSSPIEGYLILGIETNDSQKIDINVTN